MSEITSRDIINLLILSAVGLLATTEANQSFANVILLLICLDLIVLVATPKGYKQLLFTATAGITLLTIAAFNPSTTMAALLVVIGLSVIKESILLGAGFLVFSGAVVHLVGGSAAASSVLLLSGLVVCLLSNQLRADRDAADTAQPVASSETEVQKERLQSLINSMADAVIATNQAGMVIQYNGAALDLLNINVTLDNQQLSQYLHLVEKDGSEVDVIELARQKNTSVVSRDYRIPQGDEEFMNVYVSVAPVRIGFGKQGERGFIMLLRDITHEKSLEEERDEFISVVSHELRTPITITEGNISNALLMAQRAEHKDPAVLDALEAAHKQSIYLADMMNDLATLSRAERGKFKNEPETIDPYELVRSLKRDYGTDAKQKGLDIKVKLSKDLFSFSSSRLYVREILQNFITNAIKYTEKGSITIAASMKNDKTICFEVVDTGIGMSAEDKKRLFDKFFRSDDERAQAANGTGLGLYVTRKLAHLIDAKITVESELNKGSTFKVEIPSIQKISR